MAYNSSDIGSPRFLACNIIYQATQALLAGDDQSDRGVLDDAVLMMDVVCSYFTDKDNVYAQEMAGVKKDRDASKAAVPRGQELAPEVLEAFRWREMKAQFRSMCRVGKLERMESPSAEWVPEVKA